jgi:hypothetical protein
VKSQDSISDSDAHSTMDRTDNTPQPTIYNDTGINDHAVQRQLENQSSNPLHSQETALLSDQLFEEQLDHFLEEFYGTIPPEAPTSLSKNARASNFFPDTSLEQQWMDDYSASFGDYTPAAASSQLPGRSDMYTAEHLQNARANENMVYLWSMLPGNTA